MKIKRFIIHFFLSLMLTMLFIIGWRNFEFLYVREIQTVFSNIESRYLEIKSGVFYEGEILSENFKKKLNNKILDNKGILLFSANGSAGVGIIDGKLNYSNQVVKGRYFTREDFQKGNKLLAIEDSYLAKKYNEGIKNVNLNGSSYELIGIIRKKEFIETKVGMNIEYIYPYINEVEYIGNFYIINSTGEYSNIKDIFNNDIIFQDVIFNEVDKSHLNKIYLFKEIFKSDLMFKFILMSIIFSLSSIGFYIRWELGNEDSIRNIHFIFGATNLRFLKNKKYILLSIISGGIFAAIICRFVQPIMFESEYYKLVMINKKYYLFGFETIWLPVTIVYMAIYLINYIIYSWNWKRNWVNK